MTAPIRKGDRVDALGVRMTALAESFPILADKPGVRPWNPTKFYAHVRRDPAYTGAGRQAALFVLRVWNTSYDWHYLETTGLTSKPEKVRFDAVTAMGRWDPGQRAAFLAWARAPWWA